MQRIFGLSESLMSYDTYQFKDYAKVVADRFADRFDVAVKEKRRKEVFPKGCKRAFGLGAALAKQLG
jgi:hypothetical protein